MIILPYLYICWIAFKIIMNCELIMTKQILHSDIPVTEGFIKYIGLIGIE